MKWVIKERRPHLGADVSILRVSQTKAIAESFARTWQRKYPKHEIWIEPAESDDPRGAALERSRMYKNASQYEWVKGDGVDRDGHSLAWWKSKAAKWSKTEYDRPKVYIRVVCWDRAGQQSTYQEFGADDLKDAKAFAKSWLVDTGGTARVEGRVDIPYQGTKTMDLGEWENTASNGYYVWSVDGKTFVPVARNGPFENPDDAIALAKQKAKAGSTYDEVITFGGDPEAGDFEVVKSFKAWSGEVHYSTDLPRVGGRLREYR